MSMQIYVFNTKEDRPATQDEIQTLVIKASSSQAGYAELDVRLSNGLTVDSDSSDLEVEVV